MTAAELKQWVAVPTSPKASEPQLVSTKPSITVLRTPHAAMRTLGSGVASAVANGYAAKMTPVASVPIKIPTGEFARKGAIAGEDWAYWARKTAIQQPSVTLRRLVDSPTNA